MCILRAPSSHFLAYYCSPAARYTHTSSRAFYFAAFAPHAPYASHAAHTCLSAAASLQAAPRRAPYSCVSYHARAYRAPCHLPRTLYIAAQRAACHAPVTCRFPYLHYYHPPTPTPPLLPAAWRMYLYTSPRAYARTCRKECAARCVVTRHSCALRARSRSAHCALAAPVRARRTQRIMA